MKEGCLYIVATPIGNLEDITLRALRILKEVDVILCEDTRVTAKLLAHYNIQKPLAIYHQRSHVRKVEGIMERLRHGEHLALVSDAGTPGISDPGNELVAEVRRLLPDVAIIPIPGSSALTALASVAGIAMDKFLFLGFPPHKKGRKTFFQRVVSCDLPVIFYESKHRIFKALEGLEGADIQVVVGRELTKQFETIYRGSVPEVLAKIKTDSSLGEFTVITYHASR
jgi:16S rRNA (cytidine1402-2'-O)-methyltransferase